VLHGYISYGHRRNSVYETNDTNGFVRRADVSFTDDIHIGATSPKAVCYRRTKRVEEIIQLINSGDRRAARSYIDQNYTASALKEESLEDRVDTISQLYDMTRGVELQSVKEPKQNSVSALVTSKLTGQWRELIVELEPEPSHMIEGFDSVIRPTPAGRLPNKKLSEKEVVRELDAFMQQLAGANIFCGAVLLAKDGRILFSKAYGEANKDFGVPNRTDTKFNLASLNKYSFERTDFLGYTLIRKGQTP
jgi:D-alanyl-D-alanine carboxypeptidase